MWTRRIFQGIQRQTMESSIRRNHGGSSKNHQRLLYGIILALGSYVALDLCIHHGHWGDFRRCSCHCRNAAPPEPHACATRNGHYDVTSSSRGKGPNPWNQMKWLREGAECSVRGHRIEKLDDLNNFRRGYALKFTPDTEDKTHVLPWLLGSRVDLNRRARRVLVNLGANRFASSVKWFLRMYPCDFTEIHAFEMNPRQWRAPKKRFAEDSNWLPQPRGDPLRVNATPSIPDWMMQRVKVYFQVVSDRDDPSTNSVDISRFMKGELGLKAGDAVVVKMDIEGAEWPILRRWMDDPEMPQIVDELFVEVHYSHPSMRIYGWDSFAPHTRQDAATLLADLRCRGFYAHFWP